ALQRYQSGLGQVGHRLQVGKNAKHIATASRGGTDYGFDADRSDLAPGHVDDACEADHVCRVLDQPQISEHVLDFAPLPEAHPTYQPVRDAAAAEDVLECTGLGICAVQDGEVAGAPALETPQPVDLVGDVLSLLHVVVELSSLQTFSAEALGPEPFRRP